MSGVAMGVGETDTVSSVEGISLGLDGDNQASLGKFDVIFPHFLFLILTARIDVNMLLPLLTQREYWSLPGPGFYSQAGRAAWLYGVR